MSNYYRATNINSVVSSASMSGLSGYSSGGTTTGYGNMGGFTTTAYSGEAITSASGYSYNSVDIAASIQAPYVEMTSGSGTNTIPVGCVQMIAIVIGGGSGGNQGANGTVVSAGQAAYAGASGGYATCSFTVNNSGATTYTYSIGAAGFAGVFGNPQAGSGGTSVITFHSTSTSAFGGTPANSSNYVGGYATDATAGGASSGVGFIYGASTGNVAASKTSVGTNSPTAFLPFIGTYGSSGTGGSGGAKGNGQFGVNGTAGKGGYIRVYYIY